MKDNQRCLLCKSRKFQTLSVQQDRMFHLPGEFIYKKCVSCKLVFLSPQPDSKTLQKHYPTKEYFAYNKEGKGGTPGSIREYVIKHSYKPTLLSILLKFLLSTDFAIPQYREKGKILDLGCGTGDILALLKKLGWDVYGIDIDKEAVKIAKSRGLKNVRLGTYEDVNAYPDRYFDAIRLYHVIEHVDNPFLCLKLLHKKVKIGGTIFLSTPNFDSPLRKLFGRYWPHFDAPRHLFLFTPQTLAKGAEKSGLSVKSIEYNCIHGLTGSLKHFADDLLKRENNFLYTLPALLIFYPIEWLLAKLRLGDTFTMQLIRKS